MEARVGWTVQISRLMHVMGAVVALFGGTVSSVPAQQGPGPVAELPGAGRPVPVAVVSARRMRLMDHLNRGAVIVPAQGRRDLEVDVLQDNDFRQDDYFWYLTGLETPDAWLLLRREAAGGPTRVDLFLPPRNPGREQWTGLVLGPGETARRLSGIDHVRPIDSLDAVLDAVIESGTPIYVPVYSSSPGSGRFKNLLQRLGGRMINLAPVLDTMRVIKDSLEVSNLRRAIDITGEGLKTAMRIARPGMWEYQLEAEIERAFRFNGADRLGFPSIIGSGPNSTTLHYDVNRRRIQEGDLVVMDVGAEFAGYSADVTRTIPVDGKFSDRQRAIYELVLATQQVALDSARPGVTVGDLNRIARTYMREHGATLCGPENCSRYFIHGLSHWLGMRVHDVGDYRLPLAPGAVITIEPGIYLPDEQLGIRIEDDVLITESGAELLSAGVPRRVEEIESLMASGRRNETDQE